MNQSEQHSTPVLTCKIWEAGHRHRALQGEAVLVPVKRTELNQEAVQHLRRVTKNKQVHDHRQETGSVDSTRRTEKRTEPQHMSVVHNKGAASAGQDR